MLVFTLPAARFEAQVPLTGFVDDLVRWLTRVAGTLSIGETVVWPAWYGVSVQTHPLLPPTWRSRTPA